MCVCVCISSFLCYRLTRLLLSSLLIWAKLDTIRLFLTTKLIWSLIGAADGCEIESGLLHIEQVLINTYRTTVRHDKGKIRFCMYKKAQRLMNWLSRGFVWKSWVGGNVNQRAIVLPNDAIWWSGCCFGFGCCVTIDQNLFKFWVTGETR